MQLLWICATVHASQPSSSQVGHQNHSDSASDAYSRILLARRIGYPLWVPEPSDQPPEYAVRGIHIGDVGIVDSDGQFDFFFNVCLPVEHPINHQAPPTLVPFKIQLARDVKRRPDIYPPETVIESRTIQNSRLRMEVQGYKSFHSGISYSH
jgi:hypothetical protein